MWLISPLAQDLLFAGYIYGLFDTVFAGYAHSRVRIRWAVLITAAYFGLWHVPNFAGMDTGYVLFQLLYTTVGGAWILLARQYTGSILPGVLTHMACNFIGWL
ncbi:MAG: CPBP family intramembrane metalloprotease [Phycisphaerae bacterium]|nr:CPBP family intramembrane metalloprotease [Phycisphaerae bacterium]